MSVTIKDYLKAKVSMLNITLSEEHLSTFILSKGLDASSVITEFKEMDIAFTEIVLMILAIPDVSEGDMSIKYDRNALMKWYKVECGRLGIEDKIKKSETPKVKDLSFLA